MEYFQGLDQRAEWYKIMLYKTETVSLERNSSIIFKGAHIIVTIKIKDIFIMQKKNI